MVGMSVTARYAGEIMLLFLTTLLLGPLSHAGADPDEHRPVAEGHLRYDGKDVQVGNTYEVNCPAPLSHYPPSIVTTSPFM